MNGVAKNNWQQFFKFIVVSFLNTLVDFGVYGILTLGFDFWSHHLSAAHAVALVITMLHSYLWNSYWVFSEAHQTNLVAMSKFVMVSVSGLLINVCLFWLSIHFGSNDWLTKIGLMGFLFLWNFVGDKWWVYNKRYGQASNLR